MSSIIKGDRIRSQTIINLTSRVSAKEECEKQQGETVLVGSIEEDNMMQQASQESYKEAQIQAEQLLEEASRQAEELLNKALQEASAIRENAQVQKTTLLVEASATQAEMISQAKRQAEQIIEQAHDEKKQLIEQAEGELVETLSTLLRYLIGEEVYHQTDWLACIVRKMLSQESLKGEVKILVSPALFERLTEEDKAQLNSMTKNSRVECEESLSDTMCKVLTEQGTIEYDVQQGLDKVISDISILKNLK